MARPDIPLFADLRRAIGSLGDELRDMADLRVQLARLEFRSDVRTVKRFAVALSAAAVLGLTALPLLATSAAEWLDGRLGIGRAGWLLLLGLILLSVGTLLGTLAWRHFRRSFAALEETRQELREDLVWLREWLG